MSPGIFRDAALERLSSPERLDELMRVTHRRAWISLAALAAVLAMALVWGFAGRVPLKVAGAGIIVRPGGVYNVVSQGGGVVTEILAHPGGIVVRGQKVARVAQPLLAQQVASARALVAELEGTQRDLALSHQREAALQEISLKQQTASVNDQIAHTQASIAALEDGVALAAESERATEELKRQGLANRPMVASAKSELLSKKQELAAAEERLTGSRSALQRIDLQRVTLVRERELQMRDVEEKLLSARAALSRSESELALAATIVSPYNGLVIDTFADVGNLISSGAAVISLEIDLSGEKKGWKAVNEAVLFVPSADSKRIQPGMMAEISPGEVKVEEYGFMVGRVRRVSKYAATTTSMMRLLENDSLVHALEGSGPVNEIVVELIPSDRNPTGYLWSSSKSPNFHIHSGTPCAGEVVTERKRPMEMVVPYLRSKLGI